MARAGRIIRRVITYGLIGAVVNVLVAWGFALLGDVGPPRWYSPTPNSDSVEPIAGLSWMRNVTPGFAARPTLRAEASGGGLDAVVQRALADAGEAQLEYRVGAGWPWSALVWSGFRKDPPLGVRIDVLDPPSLRPPFAFWPELALGGWLNVPRAMPLHPARGLAANVPVYAGVWWGLKRMSRVACERSRLRRGLCPSCAYDLRGDHAGGCTECGWGRATAKP
ncbi:MAG: hypothetical protein IT436_16700 [Phycisphaerales bacterium]|nr:hypothetical protein [Phycisphaerales bacterium]